MLFARIVSTCIFLACAAAANDPDIPQAAQSPLTVDLFHSLTRIGMPVLSPSQAKALYVTSYYDRAKNKDASYLNVLDVASGQTTQLTPMMEDQKIGNPVWLSESEAAYLSKGCIYRHSLAPGTNGTLLYNGTAQISGFVYRPKSNRVVFGASVYPDGELQGVGRNQEAEKEKKDSAQIYDDLWARHWNKWMSPVKANVFTMEVGEEWGKDRARNLMREFPEFQNKLIRWDSEGFVVSDDGQHVAIVVRNPGLDMAWSTDVDIYLVSTGSAAVPKLLTDKFKAMAGGPAFSPDGKSIAWLQMETPGYEADINRIYIHAIESGVTTNIARDWNMSPQSLVWSADGKQIFALVPEQGNRKLYSIDVDSGNRKALTANGYVSGITRLGADRLLAMYTNDTSPANIYVVELAAGEASMRQLTHVNEDKLLNVHVSPAEDFWFAGARNDSVHGWLLKPYNFDPSKKYPLALMVHGGPQGANMHMFSLSQWNPNLYASAGFVTVQINFHGSSSYGQEFTDSITQQWGGLPYEDLMKGLDHAISTNKYIDKDRLVALGGSYGGYMMNWINGNTKRFRALVAHDGQFNTIAGYYSTDELWFPEHDLGGVPFVERSREVYERWNPERLAGEFSTPTLFIHGEKDYRLTTEQSVAPWTLLRRKGIPAKLMYFADEDHWTNKPGNSARWCSEVLRWISSFAETQLPYELGAE